MSARVRREGKTVGMDGKDNVRITVYGTRGSIPTSGEMTRVFGGATSSYLIEAAGAAVVLDAGTGIVNIPAEKIPSGPVTVLLSHPHADHIAGLPFFAPVRERGREIDVYCEPRGGLGCREMIDRYFSPPVWPVGVDLYPSEIRCRDLVLPLTVGPFHVDGIESSHPGGSTVFSVSCLGKKIVYATDFEHGDGPSRALSEFARGADLLLYDAQYSDGGYEKRKGYGHSTPSQGLAMMKDCGAGRLVLIHHDPESDDATLESRENELGGAARFAREGDVYCL